jgi:light-regulated signal transduction histidine kinase (bacteriophytochrome)
MVKRIKPLRKKSPRKKQQAGRRQTKDRDPMLRLKDLQRSNAELDQFAHVASHELQEPLRIVSGYLELLKERYHGKLDPEGDHFLRYAMEGTVRMQKLISDLLLYARAGTEAGNMQATDCETVLDLALSNLGLNVDGQGALVTHDPLPVVLAAEPQLVQVVQNLLSNGIKFHSKERPSIHVSAQRKGGEWLFSVRDNGIGIDAKDTQRIFAMFQRLHSSDDYPGTGIGLAVCQKIIERHGGRIWVESQPRRGATFYFTLPERG